MHLDLCVCILIFGSIKSGSLSPVDRDNGPVCSHWRPMLRVHLYQHVPSGDLTQLLNMAIYSDFFFSKIGMFHSYGSLPEGTLLQLRNIAGMSVNMPSPWNIMKHMGMILVCQSKNVEDSVLTKRATSIRRSKPLYPPKRGRETMRKDRVRQAGSCEMVIFMIHILGQTKSFNVKHIGKDESACFAHMLTMGLRYLPTKSHKTGPLLG